MCGEAQRMSLVVVENLNLQTPHKCPQNTKHHRELKKSQQEQGEKPAA
jgi:hypothetical protein